MRCSTLSWRALRAATLAVCLGGASSTLAAQGAPGASSPPSPDPKQSIPEKMEPPTEGNSSRTAPEADNGGAGSDTPNRKLDRGDGVIEPPRNVDPGAAIVPPVPDPGTTRVIPPPGSPGSSSGVRPK